MGLTRRGSAGDAEEGGAAAGSSGGGGGGGGGDGDGSGSEGEGVRAAPRRARRVVAPVSALAMCFVLLLRFAGDPTATPGATGGRLRHVAAVVPAAAGGARGPHRSTSVGAAGGAGSAAAAWRAAEHARQAALREAALLRERVRAKSAGASEGRRAAFGSGASREELRSRLSAAKRDAALLALETTRLTHELAPSWSGGGAAAAAAGGATAADGPSAAGAAAGGDDGAPLLTLIPPRQPTRNVTFLLQYDGDGADVAALTDALFACTRGAAGAGGLLPPGVTSELVVSLVAGAGGAAAAWEAAAARAAEDGGAFATLLLSAPGEDADGAAPTLGLHTHPCALRLIRVPLTHTPLFCARPRLCARRGAGARRAACAAARWRRRRGCPSRGQLRVAV
jgi:hypothetical protein